MARMGRKFFLAMFALVCVAASLWAQAVVVFDPGGQGPDGNYKDGNGYIEMRRGDANTWADGKGLLRANNLQDRKSARGRAVDNKNCTGTIMDAERPGWLWQIRARMSAASGGYQSAQFEDPAEARGRCELAAWGDGGPPVYSGTEVTTTNLEAPGRYDIAMRVDGVNYNLADAGSYHRLSNPLGDGGGYREITVGRQYAKFGFGWRFTYESRAIGSTRLDFTQPGRERVSFSVSQADGQWAGEVMAWDFQPGGPVLLGAWILD